MNTLKRDYVSGADRSEAAGLLDQAAQWMDGYSAIAPHSALGYRSPWQYRREMLDLVELVSPICLTNWGSQHHALWSCAATARAHTLSARQTLDTSRAGDCAAAGAV